MHGHLISVRITITIIIIIVIISIISDPLMNGREREHQSSVSSEHRERLNQHNLTVMQSMYNKLKWLKEEEEF